MKGMLGELEFTAHFLRKGYTVLTPVNPNSSYDLVIEKDGLFQRIQIKYCTPRNGIMRVELDRPMRKTLPYKDREVDAMGVYDAVNGKFYLIPVESLTNKTEFWLRTEKPKNSQIRNINSAEKFKF